MSAPHRTTLLRAGFLCAVSMVAAGALTPAFANGIRIADNPALPAFTSLQAAIDAAPDGGLLLMQAGLYGAATIDGKSLSIVGVTGAFTPRTGTLTIRNLGVAQRVLVSGVEMLGVGGPGISLTNDAGTVRLQGCQIKGGRFYSSAYSETGAPGMTVQACPQVVLSNCIVLGGDAWIEPGTAGYPGGHGVESVDSNLVLHDCTVTGGRGGIEGNPGGDSGDACNLNGWGMFASGCSFQGHTGGDGDYLSCGTGGAGGDGLDVTGALVRLLDVTVLGGNGGWSLCGPYGPGGMSIRNNGSVVNQFLGTRRKLTATALSSDAALLTLTVTGQPGDRFCLARSWSTGFAYQAAFNGVWTIPPAGPAITRPLGTIPASGTLTMQVRTPNIVGLEHRLEILQGYCVDTANVRFLTGPIHVEHLDAAGGPDCDTSGTNDFLQLIGGAPDCNRNVTLDACDIFAGTSQDQNQNGIPDECPGG